MSRAAVFCTGQFPDWHGQARITSLAGCGIVIDLDPPPGPRVSFGVVLGHSEPDGNDLARQGILLEAQVRQEEAVDYVQSAEMNENVVPLLRFTAAFPDVNLIRKQHIIY